MPKAVKSKPSLKTKVNAAAARDARTARVPLWEGPGGTGPNGGVTQSLLGRYLSDGERFRVQYVEGWNPPNSFESRQEFGNMWHVCEQAHAADLHHEQYLVEYVEDLSRRYPTDRQEIALWAEKCAALFPIYVEYWKDHPDVQARTPLLQEQTFDVPCRLPSGRTVRLRGKWDSVDVVGNGKTAAVWLQENKTKSGINSAALTRQLSFDLQTMLYLTALRAFRESGTYPPGANPGPSAPIAGVRYNVIRRPAHKSVGSMLKKVQLDLRCGRAGEWFARWNVEVSDADVARFRRECLDPVLENLWDDWEWWDSSFRVYGSTFNDAQRAKKFPNHRRRHFRMPYGIYSPLTEGGTGEVDEYVNSGSTAGLKRKTSLFTELAPAASASPSP